MVGNGEMTAKIIGVDEYKGYKIVVGFGSMVEIKALGKGKVSNPLLGSYTGRTEAKRAIDDFVSLATEEKSDGAKQAVKRS